MPGDLLTPGAQRVQRLVSTSCPPPMSAKVLASHSLLGWTDDLLIVSWLGGCLSETTRRGTAVSSAPVLLVSTAWVLLMVMVVAYRSLLTFSSQLSTLFTWS